MHNALRPTILIAAIGALAMSLGYVMLPHPHDDEALLTAVLGVELDRPQPAADFQVEWLDGTPLTSDELKGKIVIVDFWATWCGPCWSEIPHYNALHEEYEDAGVQMLGVTLQSGSVDQVREWVQTPVSLGAEDVLIDYPLVMGNDQIEYGFGPIYGFPTTFLVDSEWQIRKKWIGAVSNKTAQLRVLIDQLIEEREQRGTGEN